jgi:hypothetical protein
LLLLCLHQRINIPCEGFNRLLTLYTWAGKHPSVEILDEVEESFVDFLKALICTALSDSYDVSWIMHTLTFSSFTTLSIDILQTRASYSVIKRWKQLADTFGDCAAWRHISSGRRFVNEVTVSLSVRWSV